MGQEINEPSRCVPQFQCVCLSGSSLMGVQVDRFLARRGEEGHVVVVVFFFFTVLAGCTLAGNCRRFFLVFSSRLQRVIFSPTRGVV